MRSDSTGHVVPKLCKSYLCETCAGWLRVAALKLLWMGVVHHLERDDLRPVMFTFTEPADARLDLDSFRARHAATVKRLRRAGLLTEYVTVVEFQRRGALHPHIVGASPPDVWARLRDRSSSSSYRLRMHELRPLATSLGWGPMVDAVGAEASVGGYVTKSLGSYLTKQARREFKRIGARRVRPVRPSYGWLPGGLSGQLQGEKADPGPWIDVTEARC